MIMSRFMMGLKILLTVVFFIDIGVEANPMERCKSVHMFEPGFANLVKLGGKDKFDLFCSNMTAFSRCVDEATKAQTGLSLKSMAALLKGTVFGNALHVYANLMDFAEDVCTEGSELHKDYMVNAACFENLDGVEKKCKEQSEDAYESFSGVWSSQIISQEQHLEQSCMTTAYQLGCIGAAVHEKCGDKGFDFYKKFVAKTGYLKSGVCNPYIVGRVKYDFTNSLDIPESRRDLYRIIFALRKRRK